MARRLNKEDTKAGPGGYSFVYVDFSSNQLESLKKWLAGNERAAIDLLQHVVDSGWKVSVSQHQQTDRYLVTLTDKWHRPGCSKTSYCVEHSDLENAILGATYAATEIYDEGDKTSRKKTKEDAW